MIRHETIGCDAYPSPVVDRGQNLLTHGKIVGLVKQRKSTDSVVGHMIGKVSGALYRFGLPKQQRSNRGNLPVAKLPDPPIAKQTDYPEYDQLCKDKQPGSRPQERSRTNNEADRQATQKGPDRWPHLPQGVDTRDGDRRTK